MVTKRIQATMDGVDRAWDDPSEEQIFDLVSELNRRHRFLILDRVGAEEQYMQVQLSNDLGRYEVEYREGGPRAHYAAMVSRDDEFTAHETVAKVLALWAFEREGWRDALPWRLLDLNAD